MANETVVGAVEVAATPQSLGTIESSGAIEVAATPASLGLIESMGVIEVAATPRSPETYERIGSVETEIGLSSSQTIEAIGAVEAAATPLGIPLSTVVASGSIEAAVTPEGPYLASDRFSLRIPAGTVSPIPADPVLIPVRLTVTGLAVQTVRGFDSGGAAVPAVLRSFSGDDLLAYVFMPLAASGDTLFSLEVEGIPE